jgi:hypothetical protein
MALLRPQHAEVADRGALGVGTVQAPIELADGGALLGFFKPMGRNESEKPASGASDGGKGLWAGIAVQGNGGAG